MIELYPQMRLVHVTAVLLSGSLFLARGTLVLRGQQSKALAAPLRYLSYVIDTVLLLAAAMLVTILPGEVFANGWLAAKLALLVVYIVLGSLALKRGRTMMIRTVTYGLALLAYGFMFGIARAHHPLGVLHHWLR